MVTSLVTAVRREAVVSYIVCVCVLWKVLSDVYSFAAYAGSRAELATWQQTSAVVMKIKMGYRTPTRVKLSGWL